MIIIQNRRSAPAGTYSVADGRLSGVILLSQPGPDATGGASRPSLRRPAETSQRVAARDRSRPGWAPRARVLWKWVFR